MNKVKIFIVMAAFVLFGALAAHAQEAAAGKIGYVTLGRVFDEYAKTKEYDAVLEKKTNDYQQELKAKVDKITEAEGKLALLKDAEKEKMQAQIEKDKADVMEFRRLRETDLRKERDDKIKEILLEIEKVVKEFAEQQKYALILNDRVLIFGSTELDRTNEIIKALNDKYPAAAPKK
ncbi:MAG TPA: OmpH family outer membrane protein [Candidatus Omnitrophota bacterium]|nr:OmpH family outer membrane protein [Candidatus Omnitrophota bacterium]HPD84303.1 OmpH family outer membrane protein [Candidatus Omnitrophota bacterium]HRZ03160.1 OmpH family outer membrane protein [Candidatus Omnitrophota bacterium]